MTADTPLTKFRRARQFSAAGSTTAIAFVLALGAGQAEARSALALIPVAGERVTLADAPRLESLDRKLRSAARGMKDFTLQPRKQTSAHLQAARELGLDCALDDGVCAGKLAVLAGVDLIVFPVARLADGMVHLRLLLFVPGQKTQVAEVQASLPEGALGKNMLRALLTNLLIERPPPRVSAATPAHPGSSPADPTVAPGNATPVDDAPTAAQPPPADQSTDPAPEGDTAAAATAEPASNKASSALEQPSILGPTLLVVGGVTTGLGVVLTSGALGSAAVIELLLNAPRHPDERALLQLGGQVLVVAGGLGVLIVALGAVGVGASFIVE